MDYMGVYVSRSIIYEGMEWLLRILADRGSVWFVQIPCTGVCISVYITWRAFR